MQPNRYPLFSLIPLILAGLSTSTYALDLNKNGVSDVWESLYPAAAADLTADDDGDGDNNLTEGLAWNDPDDASSRLRLEDFTIGSTDVSFNWQQALGLRYRVWKSSNLIEWEREPNSFVGADDLQSLNESLTPKNFYRLKAERSLNSDTDALTNREEHELGTYPELWDTDGDKVPDDIEFSLGLDPLAWVDSDSDTLPDDWEQWCILSDAGDAFAALADIDATTDFDGDLINDGDEFALGTSPVEPIRNIIFFLTEDQSPDLGVLGTAGLDTPNLDALATAGVNFTRTFALSPVCSPSKMALFTGTYPHENSAHRNVTNYGTDFPLVGDPSNLGLGGVHEDLPSLIEVLRDRGWFTAITSKSHVQPVRKFPYHEGYGEGVSYPRVPADVTSYVNKTVTDAGDRPFFLCLNVAAPHLPFRTIAINNGVWNPTGGLLGDGGVTNVDPNLIDVPASFPDVPEVRQDFADYLGAIEIIDGHYAAARDAIIANGISGNTLIVFSSDHGNGLARLKQSIYGLQIPLLIDGPGVVGGRTISEPISHLDLMPTFLDFAGIPQMPSLKGKSLLPILAGDSGFADRDTVLTATHEKYDARAVTDGQYYYVRNIRQAAGATLAAPGPALNADQYTTGSPWFNRSYDATVAAIGTPQRELLRQLVEGDLPEEELYDLNNDLWCAVNLANDPAYADTKAQLRSELAGWRMYTEDYNADPSELTRRTQRYTPLPGTVTTIVENDDFNTGSGGLDTSSNWTTLVTGNSSADFNINSGTIEVPGGGAPLAQFDSVGSFTNGEPFTVSADVGFSAAGVAVGVAFGIEQEPDLEYSYWQFMLGDGRTQTGDINKDVRLRKMSDSGATTGSWLLKEDNLTNYPNGFSVAPDEFFRVQVSGTAGNALVNLRIFNPDGSVYYSKDDFDLGEPVPAGSGFGVTAWSSATAVIDNFEVETNIPGTSIETDDFSTGSGGLDTSSDWTTLVFGNSSADFTYSSGAIESPGGPEPVARFNSSSSLIAGKPFTVSTDVGFSSTGVGAGVAFGIEQEPDSEYSYWQFMLIDGRSGPGNSIDARLRKQSDSGATDGTWVLSVNDRVNYPNGFAVAPTEFFRVIVSGQAGSSLVDLTILNPNGSTYYSAIDFDLGEVIPAGSEFGITTWSSGSGVFDNFELQTN